MAATSTPIIMIIIERFNSNANYGYALQIAVSARDEISLKKLPQTEELSSQRQIYQMKLYSH